MNRPNKIGILTPELIIGDEKDFKIPKNEDYVAWCSSIKCAGDRYQIVLIKKPKVKPKAIFCPDCKCALIWKRKDGKK